MNGGQRSALQTQPTMVDTCRDTFIQTHGLNTQREHYVNYRLWVMMCPCRLIDCTSVHLGEMSIVGGLCLWVQGHTGNLIPSSQFCCKPKPALKQS